MVNLLEMMNILELHRQGMSIRAIAQLTGKDRKTVRKYISDGLKAPQYRPRPEMPSKLDPFVAYLRERVRAWPLLSGSRLLREIRQQGYTGGKGQRHAILGAGQHGVSELFQLAGHVHQVLPGCGQLGHRSSRPICTI